MIRSKEDLKDYLDCDKKQLGISRKRPRLFADEVWKYQIALRKYEYRVNIRGRVFFCKWMTLYRKAILHYWSVKLGIYIGPNTCGKGLCITHPNCIQINWHATCGENLRIQEGVNVGGGPGGVPHIGDNVYLGTGCKVIGGVKIASKCVVGANAVVVHDVVEEGITVAGVPARKVSNNDSSSYIRSF